MRYVCVGTGWISRMKHLKYYGKNPAIEMVAVVDSNFEAAKKVAKEFGIPHSYASLTTCLDETNPDIVSICVPNKFHKEMVEECLKRNVNVHCEKPLALSQEQAFQLAELEKKSTAILFTGMNKRYSSFGKILKEHIDSSDFGKLYALDLRWVRKRGIPGKGGWFTNKELSGGGVLIDLGVHLIDLSLYLADFPSVKSILSQTGSYFMDDDLELLTWAPSTNSQALSTDVEDSCVLMFTLEGGVSVTVRVAWAENCLENETIGISCYGTREGLFYQESKGLSCSKIEEGKPVITQLALPVDSTEEFEVQCEREVNDCIACCQTGKSNSNAEQAAQVMAIIDTVYVQNKVMVRS